jgi:hypothetical protein
MLRRIALLIGLTLILALVVAGTVLAGGGPNGTYVHFLQGSYDCETYWRMTGGGLVHEWRYNTACAPYSGHVGLHLVFKPTWKFSAPDCDDDGYLGFSLWTANLGAYTDRTDDDADLADFITHGSQYWVCFYEWNYAEVP